MKTLNNITKRISKLSLVILCALLISCSYSFAGEYPASKLNLYVSVETEMKIEKWMTSLSSWKTKSTATIEAIDIEEEIEVEEWMLNADESNWNYEESEREIVTENWMLDASDENWTIEENEEEVEDWMTNLNTWK